METEECAICMTELTEGEPYAVILTEVGRYHIPCLEAWLEKSHRGILGDNHVDSYLVFLDIDQRASLIDTVHLDSETDCLQCNLI